MNQTSIRERAAESEQLILDAILPTLRGVKPNRAKGGWSFHCPLEHRKQNAPAVIWVNEEGWISVHCFDCQRDADLREALVKPTLRHQPKLPPPSAPRRPSVPPHRQFPADYPASIWSATEAIPTDAAHPARRWFANRHLWRPEVEAPARVPWWHCSPRRRRGPRPGPDCRPPRQWNLLPWTPRGRPRWTGRRGTVAWVSGPWAQRTEHCCASAIPKSPWPKRRSALSREWPMPWPSPPASPARCLPPWGTPG